MSRFPPPWRPFRGPAIPPEDCTCGDECARCSWEQARDAYEDEGDRQYDRWRDEEFDQ